MKGLLHLNRSGSMHLLFYMKPEVFTSCHFSGEVFYLLCDLIRRSLYSAECFLFTSVGLARSVHLIPLKNGLMIQKCINFECPQSGTSESVILTSLENYLPLSNVYQSHTNTAVPRGNRITSSHITSSSSGSDILCV